MKFSDLHPQFRTILSQLCNTDSQRTDKLAPALGTDAQGAANILCNMRKLGLVYSHQKVAGQQYANWRVSDYGRAVFDARPHEVGSTGITKFAIVTGFKMSHTGTKEQALLSAKARAITDGKSYYVIGVVAEVTPPEQPQATVTML